MGGYLPFLLLLLAKRRIGKNLSFSSRTGYKLHIYSYGFCGDTGGLKVVIYIPMRPFFCGVYQLLTSNLDLFYVCIVRM